MWLSDQSYYGDFVMRLYVICFLHNGMYHSLFVALVSIFTDFYYLPVVCNSDCTITATSDMYYIFGIYIK